MTKAGAFLRRLVTRLLRIAVGEPARPPMPTPDVPASIPASRGGLGTWTEDSVTLLTGRIDLIPLATPLRTYRLYEPSRLADEPSLMVVLHGCRQSSTDIAIGTRLNDHADEHGWPVLYPEQSKAANKYNCWNWFDTANLRGQGECALIVVMQDAARKRYGLADAPSFLAGMSAGGALASILALRYPERWAAVAVHSGLPYAAAEDPFGALRVMREGARGLADARALRERSPEAPGLPAIVLHGNEDDVVHRRNAELVVRQFLGWNGYFAAGEDWESAKLPKVDAQHVQTAYGHSYILRRYARDGLEPVHECEVVGMGHAWSGGDPSLPYHDALGPDASALMVEFFASALARRAMATA